MSTRNPAELISEEEIRAALRSMRPDQDAFATAVHEKVKQLSQLSGNDQKSTKSDDSSWLRIAASLLPVQLVGKSFVAKGAGATFAQLTIGQKVLAIFALPAVSLILIAFTVLWAFLKIRQAVLRQENVSVDTLTLAKATARTSYQILAVSMLLLILVMLPVFYEGFRVPAFILFLVPAIVLVVLSVQLSHKQLLDRGAVGSLCSSILPILAQVSLISSSRSDRAHLLDQNLIAAVMFFGLGIILAAQQAMPRFDVPLPRATRLHWTSSTRMLGILALSSMLLIAAYFSRSLWQPVTTSDLHSYVESFEQARFKSASWKQWSVPAKWLDDQDIEVDFTRPRKLLRATLQEQEPSLGRILYHAMEGGLVGETQVSHIFDFDEARKKVFGDTGIGMSRRQLDRMAPSIMALAIAKEFTEPEKDQLGECFESAMNDLRLDANKSFPLKETRLITLLAQAVNRPIDVDAHRSWMHALLSEYQQLTGRLGLRRGGFSPSVRLDFSNEEATTQAIELMEVFGVPEGVDLIALRSYLRPAMADRFRGLKPQACIRVASLQRLESLPDVPPLTWMDYARCEQNLIMAILLVLLCIFATLTAPNLRRTLPGTTAE